MESHAKSARKQAKGRQGHGSPCMCKNVSVSRKKWGKIRKKEKERNGTMWWGSGDRGGMGFLREGRLNVHSLTSRLPPGLHSPVRVRGRPDPDPGPDRVCLLFEKQKETHNVPPQPWSCPWGLRERGDGGRRWLKGKKARKIRPCSRASGKKVAGAVCAGSECVCVSVQVWRREGGGAGGERQSKRRWGRGLWSLFPGEVRWEGMFPWMEMVPPEWNVPSFWLKKIWRGENGSVRDEKEKWLILSVSCALQCNVQPTGPTALQVRDFSFKWKRKLLLCAIKRS